MEINYIDTLNISLILVSGALFISSLALILQMRSNRKKNSGCTSKPRSIATGSKCAEKINQTFRDKVITKLCGMFNINVIPVCNNKLIRFITYILYPSRFLTSIALKKCHARWNQAEDAIDCDGKLVKMEVLYYLADVTHRGTWCQFFISEDGVISLKQTDKRIKKYGGRRCKGEYPLRELDDEIANNDAEIADGWEPGPIVQEQPQMPRIHIHPGNMAARDRNLVGPGAGVGQAIGIGPGQAHGGAINAVGPAW